MDEDQDQPTPKQIEDKFRNGWSLRRVGIEFNLSDDVLEDALRDMFIEYRARIRTLENRRMRKEKYGPRNPVR